MERKLQCISDVTSAVSGSATPPRPPTRHRRDTNASTAPTPHSEATVKEDDDDVKQLSDHSHVPSTRAPELTTPRPTTSIIEASTTRVVTTTPPVTELPDGSRTIVPATLSPHFQPVESTPHVIILSTEASTEHSEISTSVVTQNIMNTEETTLMDTTTSESSTFVSEPMSTETVVITTPEHSLPTTPHASTPKIITSTNPHVPAPVPAHPMSPVHHQISPGTPRNVAALAHVGNHPPMVIAVSAAGLPRNVPHVHAPLPPPLMHPVMAEGTPRIAGKC
jgi:hypothetical protein